jgi:hypothetical protein
MLATFGNQEITGQEKPVIFGRFARGRFSDCKDVTIKA